MGFFFEDKLPVGLTEGFTLVVVDFVGVLVLGAQMATVLFHAVTLYHT